MEKYVVSLKNGSSFIIRIKRFSEFMDKLTLGTKDISPNNFFVGEDVLVNINEMSAIYPVDSHYLPKAE